MFGIRSDGRRIWGIDPIVQLTPYIMPTRVDAQNMCKQTLDYDSMIAYIRAKKEEGHNISFMVIVIAAFVRAITICPELNRFVVNKQIYARNHISVSFVVLKDTDNGSIDESVAKIELNPTDTIFDIAEKVAIAIEYGRKSTGGTLTDQLARALLAIPGLATVGVGILKLLDRYGLLPRFVHEASPFHTSLFVTNMASINMTYIYHHLYNFGTTSVFVAIGKIERALSAAGASKIGLKRKLPLGIVTDERICGGASYAHAFSIMLKFLNDPTLLESPPESVKTETKMRPAKDLRKAAEEKANK